MSQSPWYYVFLGLGGVLLIVATVYLTILSRRELNKVVKQEEEIEVSIRDEPFLADKSNHETAINI